MLLYARARARRRRRLLQTLQPLFVWHRRHTKAIGDRQEDGIPGDGLGRDEVQRTLVRVDHLLQRRGDDVNCDPCDLLQCEIG